MLFVKSLVCVLALWLIDDAAGSRSKIFNGKEVDPPNNYPSLGWMLIGIKRVKCGVTLIAPQFGLTAASCAGADAVSVTFGDHSRTTVEGTEQTVTINTITEHPDYNATSFENDIAVLKFDTELNITGSAVSDIPLLTDDFLTAKIFTKHCRVAGWGYEVSGATDLVRDQSDVPFEIVVDMNTTACAVDMAPSSVACYSPFRDPTSLTCEGDIGGPFYCKRKRVWTLCGVMSGWNVGMGCTFGNRAVTKVSMFNTWITSIINA